MLLVLLYPMLHASGLDTLTALDHGNLKRSGCTRHASSGCPDQVPTNTADSAAQAFSEWLRQRGAQGIGSKVAIREAQGAGYGLFATTNLPEGDTVLLLPPTCYLTEDTALDGPLAEFYLRCVDALADLYGFSDAVPYGEPLLAVQILIEVANGYRAAFAPYVAMLPRPEACEAAWLWSAEERAALLDPDMAARGAKIAQSVAREYEALHTAVFAPAPDIFPPVVFTLANYRWAKHVVLSRAYAVDGLGEALVPGIDVANHIAGVRYGVRLVAGNAGVGLVADRAYRAGDQIWSSYGRKSNAELLLSFGFVLPDAAADVRRACLRIPPPCESARWHTKAHVLQGLTAAPPAPDGSLTLCFTAPNTSVTTANVSPGQSPSGLSPSHSHVHIAGAQAAPGACVCDTLPAGLMACGRLWVMDPTACEDLVAGRGPEGALAALAGAPLADPEIEARAMATLLRWVTESLRFGGVEAAEEGRQGPPARRRAMAAEVAVAQRTALRGLQEELGRQVRGPGCA